MVSRVTVTMTGLAALALVPAALVAVYVILPAFVESLPALFVLLPAVVALSISKILSAYLNGLAHTSFVSFMATSALILNIVMNFVLIPAWGIVGAAAASLISYTFGAVLAITFSSRLSGAPPLSFVIPTRHDFANVVSMTTHHPRPGARRACGPRRPVPDMDSDPDLCRRRVGFDAHERGARRAGRRRGHRARRPRPRPDGSRAGCARPRRTC